MPGLFHQGREYLSAEDVERIYGISDSLDVHREWVIVPLDTTPLPTVLLQPDGKILIHAPGQAQFEPWLAGLRDRLSALELGRAPRRGDSDPKFTLTGPGGTTFCGTRGYLRGRFGST